MSRGVWIPPIRDDDAPPWPPRDGTDLGEWWDWAKGQPKYIRVALGAALFLFGLVLLGSILANWSGKKSDYALAGVALTSIVVGVLLMKDPVNLEPAKSLMYDVMENPRLVGVDNSIAARGLQAATLHFQSTADDLILQNERLWGAASLGTTVLVSQVIPGWYAAEEAHTAASHILAFQLAVLDLPSGGLGDPLQGLEDRVDRICRRLEAFRHQSDAESDSSGVRRRLADPMLRLFVRDAAEWVRHNQRATVAPSREWRQVSSNMLAALQGAIIDPTTLPAFTPGKVA